MRSKRKVNKDLFILNLEKYTSHNFHVWTYKALSCKGPAGDPHSSSVSVDAESSGKLAIWFLVSKYRGEHLNANLRTVDTHIQCC